MKIYIPATLPTGLLPEKHRDKYYYFLHKIYEERIFNKEYEKNAYVNLNASIMRYIIGRWSFESVRDDLLSKGIIETDNKYIVGKKSKGYRLTEPYRKVKHVQAILNDNRIIKRIGALKQNQAINIPAGVEYKRLYQWLRTITINHQAAIEFIGSNYYNEIDRLNCNTIAVNKINEKDFFFIADSSAGRVHTNISNLSKDLRRFLHFDNMALVNVDISNSQPFLFNLLIKKTLKALNEPNFTLYPYFDTCYSNNGNTFLSYDGQFVNDIAFYEKLTSEGRFYEYLMQQMKYKGDRNKFKKGFFGKVFFTENKPNYVYKERKIFDKLFPNVSKIIDYYKRCDNKTLPVDLQKSEREIIINKVVKKIVVERPKLPIYTIHDSILTTRGNENYISKVITEQFKDKYNLKPNVKFEYLHT